MYRRLLCLRYDAVLRSTGNLKQHMLINHCPERMQRCRLCGFETSSRKRFHDHVVAHSKEHLQTTKQVKQNGGRKLLKCGSCSFTCSSKLFHGITDIFHVINALNTTTGASDGKSVAVVAFSTPKPSWQPLSRVCWLR